MHPLDDHAFQPRRVLDSSELNKFFERRKRLYRLCTEDEQRCLAKLARWYDSHDPRLLKQPNLFSESAWIEFRHRALPMLRLAKPSPRVLVFARINHLVRQAESWRGRRHRIAILAHLHAVARESGETLALGVAHFLRTLPLNIGLEEQNAFEADLDALADDLLAATRTPPLERFEAAVRCIRRATELDGPTAKNGSLHKQLWRLLLAVANEDAAAAARLIDTHARSPERRDALLQELHLHHMPEVAYQLAMKLRPLRAKFAAWMLHQSITNASFQLHGLEPETADALDKVMDASCRLLAEWTSDDLLRPGEPLPLGTMGLLLQFGNPQDDYWRRLPAAWLPLLRQQPPENRDRQLSLLAQLAVLSPPPLADEALDMFTTCAGAQLARIRGPIDEWCEEVRELGRVPRVLGHGILSSGNRRIPASPDHPLLRAVEQQLCALQDRLLAAIPGQALRQCVEITLPLHSETLFRKRLQALRDMFEPHARSHPADAGLALKRLVQYCGYSQPDEEMYRKLVCRETFDALLPLLERISPADATLAREGIGWRPGRSRR